MADCSRFRYVCALLLISVWLLNILLGKAHIREEKKYFIYVMEEFYFNKSAYNQKENVFFLFDL